LHHFTGQTIPSAWHFFPGFLGPNPIFHHALLYHQPINPLSKQNWAHTTLYFLMLQSSHLHSSLLQASTSNFQFSRSAGMAILYGILVQILLQLVKQIWQASTFRCLTTPQNWRSTKIGGPTKMGSPNLARLSLARMHLYKLHPAITILKSEQLKHHAHQRKSQQNYQHHGKRRNQQS